MSRSAHHLLFLILTLAVLQTRNCASQTDAMEWIATPSHVLAFADHLYETGDYSRAIGEYKRFLYSFPQEPRGLQARFRIGLCYQKSGHLENAIAAFKGMLEADPPSQVSQAVRFEVGECYFLGRDYEKASELFEELHTDRSLLMAGWSMLRKGEYAQASDRFQKANRVKPDGYLSELSAALSEESLKGLDLSRKSTVLACVVSVPLPGAGRAYCGRLGDGIFSFLMVAGAYAATYHYYSHDEDLLAAGFLGLGVLFHAGDVYGAVNSARRYNAVGDDAFIKGIENSHNLVSILLD